MSDLQEKEHFGKSVYRFSRNLITEDTGIIITVYLIDHIKQVKEKIGDELSAQVFILLKDRDYSRWFHKRFLKECKKRKNRSFFDYKYLSKDIVYHFLPEERQWCSLSYGISQYVKKRVKNRHYDAGKCSIMHGVALTSDKIFSPVDLNPLDGNVFTVNVSEYDGYSNNLNIYAMKPYIKYARSLYSYGKLASIKKKLGKTLLVMPSHNVPGVSAKYSCENFIHEIERIRSNYGYKTVMVSLHYQDIRRKVDVPYRQAGYKICTAGHVNDVFFLPRLRSIMLLSDMVVSNDYGTFLTYAISLNKPVYVFQQEIFFDGLKQDCENYMQKEMEDDLFYEINQNMEKEKKEILDVFSTYQEKITKEQYMAVRRLCSMVDKTAVRKIVWK